MSDSNENVGGGTEIQYPVDPQPEAVVEATPEPTPNEVPQPVTSPVDEEVK
jgi:hypothetical protein